MRTDDDLLISAEGMFDKLKTCAGCNITCSVITHYSWLSGEAEWYLQYDTTPHDTTRSHPRRPETKENSCCYTLLSLFRELKFFLAIRAKIPKSWKTLNRKLVSPAVMNNELQNARGFTRVAYIRSIRASRSFMRKKTQGINNQALGMIIGCVVAAVSL